jgi:hypothetical protein
MLASTFPSQLLGAQPVVRYGLLPGLLPRWLLFCVWFVRDLLSWQTPGALSPHPEDLS